MSSLRVARRAEVRERRCLLLLLLLWLLLNMLPSELQALSTRPLLPAVVSASWSIVCWGQVKNNPWAV